MTAWALGWRGGALFAALIAGTTLLIDSGLLRFVDPPQAASTVAWNALSDFCVFTAVAVVTDRVYRERERWRTVNAERASLLRLLEREFPRPLREIDWFARTFTGGFGSELALSESVRDQVAGLRHHVQEVSFLAIDLIRIGRVHSGELLSTLGPVDLKRIASDASNQVLDRNRVLFSATTDQLTVRADPESLHHAISAVIGRLIEHSPAHEVVHVFARGSEAEAVVEFVSRAQATAAGDFELAELLAQANGGRLVIIPRGAELGMRLNLYIPRVHTPLPDPSVAAPLGAHG